MADDQVKQAKLPRPHHKGQERRTEERHGVGKEVRLSKNVLQRDVYYREEKVVDDTSCFDSGYSSVSSISSSRQSISTASDFDSRCSLRSTSSISKQDSKSDMAVDPKSASAWADSGSVFDSGLGIETSLSSDISQKVTLDEGYSSRASVGSDKDLKISEKRWTNISFLPSSLTVAFEQDQDGDTILHLAIIRGALDVVLALIQLIPSSEYLDIANNLCQTPLHLAVLTGQDFIVRRLVIAGATLDCRDRYGNTALHLACQYGQLACAKVLMAPVRQSEVSELNVSYSLDQQYHSVDDLLELRNYEGKTCVHVAAFHEQKKMLEYLVLCGADINALEGKNGHSALHYAVETQKLDLVDFLVNRCHADLNMKNYSGLTPLHLAWKLYDRSLSSRLTMLVKKLKEYGGIPSERPEDSDSDSESELSSEEVRTV